MQKTHLYISAVSLVGLMAGAILFSTNIFFAFVDVSFQAQLVRGLLCLLVFTQLLTSPPRHMSLRAITAAVALATGLGTIAYVGSALSVSLVDVFVLFHAAIALGITALELKPDAAPSTSKITA